MGLSELAHQADRVWRWLRQGSAALDEQVYLEHPTRLPEAWAQAWARTEALFLELQAEAAAAGARLAVVIFPSRPELLPGGEREYPARRVRTLCEAHGIPVLDLTPGFAADPDHARAYLQRNAHWSVHGHARAAAATAAWVEANDLLR